MKATFRLAEFLASARPGRIYGALLTASLLYLTITVIVDPVSTDFVLSRMYAWVMVIAILANIIAIAVLIVVNYTVAVMVNIVAQFLMPGVDVGPGIIAVSSWLGKSIGWFRPAKAFLGVNVVCGISISICIRPQLHAPKCFVLVVC